MRSTTSNYKTSRADKVRSGSIIHSKKDKSTVLTNPYKKTDYKTNEYNIENIGERALTTTHHSKQMNSLINLFHVHLEHEKVIKQEQEQQRRDVTNEYNIENIGEWALTTTHHSNK